jgi:L,D-transpeptidase ErfK/SrfK
MRLGLPGYLIHGTNRPAGVGMRVTHGCIRMFPEDIAYLFDQVAVNTPVRIINEPIKLGWDGELLVLEVHRALDVAEPLPAEQGAVSGAVAPSATADAGEPGNLAGDDTASDGGGQLAGAAPSDDPVTVELLPARKNPLTTLTEQFVVVTERRVGELDWDLAEGLLGTADGIPSPVGRAIKYAATSAASR